MKQFGLDGRAMESLDEVNGIGEYNLNYSGYNQTIENARQKSMSWLAKALNSGKMGKV